MIRVTADSNIYISALQFGGKPLRLLEQAIRGEIEIAISPAILAETLRALPSDPDDNRVLECAVAAGSDAIVTGDSHLLVLKSFHGPTSSPSERSSADGRTPCGEKPTMQSVAGGPSVALAVSCLCCCDRVRAA